MPSTTPLTVSTADTRNRFGVNTDICDTISRLATETSCQDAFYRQAFSALAEAFDAIYGVMTLHRPATVIDECYATEDLASEVFHDMAEAELLECQSIQHAVGRSFLLKQTGAHVAAIAVPVGTPADETFGAVVFVIPCAQHKLASAYLVELRALVTLVAMVAPGVESRAVQQREQDSAGARAVAKASQFSSVHELAFQITNTLSNKLGCDQVAMAAVQGMNIELLAISGLDHFHVRSPGTLRIRQAMEECVDAGKTVVFQHEQAWNDDQDNPHFRLHQKWHAESGACVASIPIYDNGNCIAIVSLRRNEKAPFTNEELTSTASMLAPYGPSLRLLQQASEGAVARVARDLRTQWTRLTARGARTRQVAVAVAALALLWFCFGSITYRVSVPSVVTARQMRTFSAPFEGRIAEAMVRPGDFVKANQPLYRMDTEDLELEAQRLNADISSARHEAASAYRESDSARAAQAEARLHALSAQLAINRNRADRATAVAPADGHVVSGDLDKRIGEIVTMGAPLLDFAPIGNRSTELRLPEHIVSDLAAGMTGTFAGDIRPESPVECRIRSVHLAPDLVDGKKSFLAEAELAEDPAWMRVGLEGTARIDVGKRRVWWVCLHRLINATRLHLGF